MKVMELIRANRAYFEDFITRSTYHSNAIEGNTLSYAETYAIIFSDNSLTITATAHELYEAINHKYAIEFLFQHIDEPLSEQMIKNIAQIISRNINEFSGYRKGQVFIRGAGHIPPAPQMVPAQMMYFVNNYNNTVYKDAYEKAAATHLAFERIHPFEDGNGRTGRLLINYEMIRSNLAPVVIPKEARAEYLALLANEQLPGLAALLARLSAAEEQRIQTFAAAERMREQAACSGQEQEPMMP